MNARPEARDLTLDAWRGISVLMVILSHLTAFRYSMNTESPAMALVNATGPLGVKFFFVISGYIITKLLLEEHQRDGSISIISFYRRRCFRILPALWLYLGCVFTVASLGLITPPGSWTTAAAFLCNTGIGVCGWFLTHLWSLGVEEQFYLAWPLIVVAVACRGVSMAAFALLTLFIGLAQFSLLFAAWLNNGLAFGCIAAGALYAASPTARAILAKHGNLPLMALALLLLLGRPIIPLLFPGQYRLHDITTPFLICIVIFSSFRYRNVLERGIAWQFLAKVGLVSYGMYLWQQLFLAPPANYLKDSMLLVWPLFALLALGSYSLVERPLLRLGRTLSRGGAKRDRSLAQAEPRTEPRD
jgi:peptidoglycan/LPS O-acetylase OafA/YrhL